MGEDARHPKKPGGTMKLRTTVFLLGMILALSSAASAHPNECSNLTIKGTYAFTVHGQILTPGGPLLIDGIAKTTFDGHGNLTQLDAVAENGTLAQIWRPGTGAYTLNSDCTGIMTIFNQDQPALHLAIVVSHSGDLIHTVVSDPGVAVTSDAERVVTPKD
jgi:hypothetical protein